MPEYLAAEAALSGRLWERGVALHTGEINLAAAIVAAWDAGSPAPSVLSRRQAQLGVSGPRALQEVLLCGYPEIVRVVGVLVNRPFVTSILDVRTSALVQAGRFTHAVASAIGGPANDHLRTISARIIGHAHRATLHAYGLRRNQSAKNRACPLDRALVVASYQKRASLLRHADSRGLPAIESGRSGGAPRARVIRNWPYPVDELAIEQPSDS